MKQTIPYTHLIEILDSQLSSAIDELETNRDLAEDMDVITDEESETIADYLEQLEAIRGSINEA